MVAILEYELDGKRMISSFELVEGEDYQAQIDYWAKAMEVTIIRQVIASKDD